MTPQKNTILIQFENVTVGEAGVHATHLRDVLRDFQHDDDGQELESVDLRKDSQETMDFGTTLVLVLGAPAMVVTARGIANYLTRAGVKVKIKNGEIETVGVDGKDVAQIVKAIKGDGSK